MIFQYCKMELVNLQTIYTFQVSLAGIQQHDLLLKMRFSVLKLQFLLQKWIQHPLLPLGHPFYAIPITENYHLNNFYRILAKKLTVFQVQMIQRLANSSQNISLQIDIAILFLEANLIQFVIRFKQLFNCKHDHITCTLTNVCGIDDYINITCNCTPYDVVFSDLRCIQ